ncbi:phage tail assembly chaperone family protein, TAC [Ferribacterium limneticum]|uniref:phage tail assembly chaperone family protein, TAC n=1 Tax=Ferribacterium limneticum TaxID=76259 RepID=UPI001CF93285|nr:phage tail assembly chaperone family protein, TAC [Ferribacterium limneticum]UCV27009.1 phage tail assembly chaperone family protein, TAC [Ferribacterium limneticum]UCV30926.1 phage tail assembly chaperone family protein, TAC [Ferribacterium limneticum]
MNLEQLRTAGAFVSSEPVKVPVTWKDHSFDLYVRKLAFGDAERLMNDEQNSTVALIAAAVLLGEGAEQTPITRDDAERLDVSLAAAMLTAINQVNAVKN